MPAIIFDIETGPLADEIIRPMMPDPKMPKHPGEFDLSSVKIDHLVDPVKIEAKKVTARNKHLAEVKSQVAKCDKIYAEAWEKFKGKAALNAGIAEVIAIGYLRSDITGKDKPPHMVHCRDEKISEADLLTKFWKLFANSGDKYNFIGHFILSFDLPFLRQRSILRDVPVPSSVLTESHRRWSWHSTFLDTEARWIAGAKWGDSVSLESLSMYFGGKKKTGDGANFAELFKSDRKAAIDYLKNDLDMTFSIASAMGMITD